MEILIGADPEFFLRDKETGKFVSAHGMVEGTKKEPQKVKNGAVQVDGMALEFNIDPARTENEFVNNISTVLEQLRGMVPDKYEFVFESVAHFDGDYIRNQPEVARQLGCEPDFNAYTHKPNPTPDAAVNFRTASGHIHIGWTNEQDTADPEHIEACEMLVEQLDSYIGLASVVLDPISIRRELYGKAGAYRPKPYGVEYRTPSNAWLKREETIKDMFNKTLKTTQKLMDGSKVSSNLDYKARKIIDENLVNTAHYNMSYYFKRPKIYDEVIGSYITSLTKAQIDSINGAEKTYYSHNKNHYTKNVGIEKVNKEKVVTYHIPRNANGTFARRVVPQVAPAVDPPIPAADLQVRLFLAMQQANNAPRRRRRGVAINPVVLAVDNGF